MKKEINVFEHVQDILQGVKSGVLLTTCSEGKANTMTISWGALGIEWGKPVFTTYVRESRFTREILDQTGEFTINIPYGSYDKNILAFCGSKSGRDVDKIKELNLTLEEGECVAAPAIRELPLTLECRVVYKQPQDVALLPAVHLQVSSTEISFLLDSGFKITSCTPADTACCINLLSRCPDKR